MPYYMDHPEHGAHICYTPEDVAAHESAGWVLRDPTIEAVATPDEREELMEKLEAAGIKYDRRWGVSKLREALS